MITNMDDVCYKQTFESSEPFTIDYSVNNVLTVNNAIYQSFFKNHYNLYREINVLIDRQTIHISTKVPNHHLTNY